MDPQDDINDLSRAKLPYERHRREPAPTTPLDPYAAAPDPIKWKPVRLGLAIIIGGWLTILSVAVLFTVFFIVNHFKHWVEPATMQTLVMIAGGLILLGGLVSFGGQCVCCAVPKFARARGWIIAAVVARLVTFCLLGYLIPTILAEPQPLPDQTPPVVEPPPAESVAPRVESVWPPLTLSKGAKIALLAVFLASQIMFTLFLKKVALFFHDVFLADSAMSYLTLLVLHTSLVALLPSVAMIACFFWVILLALEFLLLGWQLQLLLGTRKAIG